MTVAILYLEEKKTERCIEAAINNGWLLFTRCVVRMLPQLKYNRLFCIFSLAEKHYAYALLVARKQMKKGMPVFLEITEIRDSKAAGSIKLVLGDRKSVV